jgi:hypothetical protein
LQRKTDVAAKKLATLAKRRAKLMKIIETGDPDAVMHAELELRSLDTDAKSGGRIPPG